MDDDIEPPRDPKVITAQSHFSECDLQDHRACTLYIGYYVPGYRRKSHHRRNRSHHHKPGYSHGSEYGHDISKPVTPPSERVHFILGEEEDGSHEPHPLFSEMEELFHEGKETEWRETARWIKFEEDVEEGGNRWSKPHVATVSLHSLFELRSCILNETIVLDMDAHSLEEIADLVLEHMESSNQISSDVKSNIKEVLLRPHRHQHELRSEWSEKGSRLPLIRSLTDVGRNSIRINQHRNCASASALSDNIAHNLSSLSFRGISQSRNSNSPEDASSENVLHRINQAFMRKIPPKAEASNILVGELECLDKVISAFIRLSESCNLGDLTEVPVPTRFIFLLLGPIGNSLKYHEIGRAIATLLSDEVFHGVAYKAKDRLDLLAGVDEFLDATTVLPPGVWDPSTRIEPPIQTASQESRKKPEPKKEEKKYEPSDSGSYCQDEDLSCSKRPFGGLIADIRRKAPWYISDFKDCLSLQCISSVVFLYFACIAQIITFGSLLAQDTNQRMAAVECLLSALVCGVIYSLFSGQPLTFLGSTGPVLVFESIVYDMCEWYSMDYLSVRLWIGLWTSVYLFVFVAFNVASLVRYITRFTQEIFATLVSTYFIYKAFKNVVYIGKKFPLKTGYSKPVVPLCICDLPAPVNFTIISEDQCQSLNGILVPPGCSYTPSFYVPNIFLMSVILFIGTFGCILLLREVKNTPFFPSKVRTCISDFSVLIAVVIMTALDIYVGIHTPKLEVPQTFKPTWSGRDWIIPLFGHNPWWSAIFSMLPALLLTVLIFMDQQITAVIVNRKENKLKKGSGYHLDLFVLAILIAICSVLGLPWFVAATVLSITHVNSLKRLSKCSAPGEKPRFLGVREQRMTHFCVCILIGLSILLTNILQFIPMPILYGVFLFMGVNSLKGIQFFDRILLMFMPEKYQPDYSYLRHVPIRQVKYYTLVQLLFFGLLFCCKLFKSAAFFFPLLLLAVIFARKILGCFFNKTHLKLLDDDMPETTKFKKEDTSAADKISNSLSEVICVQNADSKSTFKSQNSHANINISEVLMQSGIWKSIDQQSNKTTKKFLVAKSKKKKHGKRDSSKSEERRRLSVMEEEDEEQVNSTSCTSPLPSTPCDPSSETNNGTVV